MGHFDALCRTAAARADLRLVWWTEQRRHRRLGPRPRRRTVALEQRTIRKSSHAPSRITSAPRQARTPPRPTVSTGGRRARRGHALCRRLAAILTLGLLTGCAEAAELAPSTPPRRARPTRPRFRALQPRPTTRPRPTTLPRRRQQREPRAEPGKTKARRAARLRGPPAAMLDELTVKGLGTEDRL